MKFEVSNNKCFKKTKNSFEVHFPSANIKKPYRKTLENNLPAEIWPQPF
jgi:hypothetical protein